MVTEPRNATLHHSSKIVLRNKYQLKHFDATAITHCAKQEVQFNGTHVEMRTQHGNLQLKLVHSDNCSRLDLIIVTLDEEITALHENHATQSNSNCIKK